MSPQKPSRDTHLLLRGNTWHIHWNVPKPLRSNPLFRGKAIYSKTLKTSDVHEARKMRDLIVSEFTAMAGDSATQASRKAFLQHYAEAKKAREDAKKKLVYLDDEEVFNVMDDLESAFDVDAVIKKGDFTRADAYLAAIHDNQEVAEKYDITFKDAAYEFIKEHDGKIAQAIISRVRNASASLIKATGKKDIKLKDVTSRQVTRWIESIKKTSSDSTRQGYLASLHRMWHWVWLNEHVDGISPFKGVKMDRQGDATSYKAFTVEEVKAIIDLATPALLELTRFGLITGCRLSELIGLTSANFIDEDVPALQIFDGKTKAAERLIPLPAPLWSSLKQIVEAGTWQDATTETWSYRFGTLKLKATGKRDRTKAYHSFRHMTATAYDQVLTEERISAAIIGHKHKRGESMTYGLYSEGLAPKQYLEAVEKMLAGEYMQSFLKLFPQ